MKTTRWENFKHAFKRNFIDFLLIFAAEDQFIHKHRHKSSQINEQGRYGSTKKEK
ncbi:hypothetical protein [Limosilactobacillus sp.]|jgi:hypothetical protein|uniref:hypothetical protein n=1 Tax=Limosilactobacillus sp. TaxID=2773925 RepID=UPI0025BC6C50|nr:hypothetical protein [Limosilactobacillus sp.]MCH3921320.1 hypothetical protein [Limosilactobacillus sp.]MCH3928091.1 hypothetical protein [Limosilactobacillus sp.]